MEQLKMYRPDMPVVSRPLPAGYSIRPAHAGEGSDWCRCCKGGCLGVEEESEELFAAKMLEDELVSLERVLFAVDEKGRPAATATARFSDNPERGYLHMVGCDPEYRGMGLSLPVCAAALELLRSLGRMECLLSTDDFRLPAIRTYLRLGFMPLLYEPDMEGRWRALLPLSGRESLSCIAGNGDPVTLRV